MLISQKPTEAELNSFFLEQSKLDVCYSGVEMTRLGKSGPAQYRRHVADVVLGCGKNTFDDAVQHMKEWHHFALSWILLFPAKPTIAPNTTLLVCANHRWLWSVNACRIIYIIDESSESKKRFGFAYGTLPGHVEQGEERFLIEWDAESDLVRYEILAYSRPNHPLVSVLWPVGVLIQDHFRKESLLALKNRI